MNFRDFLARQIMTVPCSSTRMYAHIIRFSSTFNLDSAEIIAKNSVAYNIRYTVHHISCWSTNSKRNYSHMKMEEIGLNIISVEYSFIPFKLQLKRTTFKKFVWVVKEINFKRHFLHICYLLVNLQKFCPSGRNAEIHNANSPDALLHFFLWSIRTAPSLGYASFIGTNVSNASTLAVTISIVLTFSHMLMLLKANTQYTKEMFHSFPVCYISRQNFKNKSVFSFVLSPCWMFASYSIDKSLMRKSLCASHKKDFSSATIICDKLCNFIWNIIDSAFWIALLVLIDDVVSSVVS